MDDIGRVVGVTTFMVTSGQALNFCIGSEHVVELLASKMPVYEVASAVGPRLPPKEQRWRNRSREGKPFEARVFIVGSSESNVANDIVVGSIRRVFQAEPDIVVVESDPDWVIAALALDNAGYYTISLVVTGAGYADQVRAYDFFHSAEFSVNHFLFNCPKETVDDRINQKLGDLRSYIAKDRIAYSKL